MNDFLQNILYPHKEPLYEDFLYQEIKVQTDVEILNTIVFESLIRNKNIKELLLKELSISSEDRIDKLLNDKRTYIEKFDDVMEIFQRNISAMKQFLTDDELSKQFDYFNETEQKSIGNIINFIDNISNLLNNIELKNVIDDVKEDKKIKNTSLLDRWNLNVFSLSTAFHSVKRYYEISYELKLQYLNNNINEKIYQKRIQEQIKQLRKIFIYPIHTTKIQKLQIGYRPYVLPILSINIPYYVDDTTKTRLKKSLDFIKDYITQVDIKSNTKMYFDELKKEVKKVLILKPETFAERLFAYDWIQYILQQDETKHLTQKECVEILKEKYNFKIDSSKITNIKKFIENLSPSGDIT